MWKIIIVLFNFVQYESQSMELSGYTYEECKSALEEYPLAETLSQYPYPMSGYIKCEQENN